MKNIIADGWSCVCRAISIELDYAKRTLKPIILADGPAADDVDVIMIVKLLLQCCKKNFSLQTSPAADRGHREVRTTVEITCRHTGFAIFIQRFGAVS